MRLVWYGLLAAAALAAHPVRAQEDLPVPSAAAIERMCSPAGAFQYAFGQTGVPGSSKLMRSMSKGLGLPDTAAPFTHAKPWSTEWSDRFFGMEYIAPDPRDEETVDVFAIALDERLAAAGWELQDEGFDPPLYMYTLSGDWTWLRPLETSDGATQLVLGLSAFAGDLTLSCGRADLALAHAEEALGELPPDTPRPQAPEIAVPAVRSEADCARPEVVADVQQMLADRTVDGFMATMMARTSYRDRLTAWMLWKLGESGKISPEELVDLSFSAIGEVSPGGNPLASFEMVLEAIELLGPLAEAEVARDVAAMCRSLVPFHDWFARVDALTLRQTEAAQSALTEEAARLGVSFD